MSALNSIKRWFQRPLSCQDVNQFIVDYLEETLPARTRVRFEKHIADCPNCGPFFDQYLQTIQLAREEGTPSINLPEELVEATLTFLRDHYDDPDTP
jgi:predicted anti-sigma-YlaC factor YlaD